MGAGRIYRTIAPFILCDDVIRWTLYALHRVLCQIELPLGEDIFLGSNLKGLAVLCHKSAFGRFMVA